MGKNQACRIEGVGFLKIHMFDGVNHTLTQVRFKPNMRKNLISLEELDSHSLEWRSSKSVLYVILCDKKVILWFYKRNNLYLLKNITIFGEFNFTRFHREMSHVWHFKLGNMSDRYMSLLMRLSYYQIG